MTDQVTRPFGTCKCGVSQSWGGYSAVDHADPTRKYCDCRNCLNKILFVNDRPVTTLHSHPSTNPKLDIESILTAAVQKDNNVFRRLRDMLLNLESKVPKSYPTILEAAPMAVKDEKSVLKAQNTSPFDEKLAFECARFAIDLYFKLGILRRLETVCTHARIYNDKKTEFDNRKRLEADRKRQTQKNHKNKHKAPDPPSASPIPPKKAKKTAGTITAGSGGTAAAAAANVPNTTVGATNSWSSSKGSGDATEDSGEEATTAPASVTTYGTATNANPISLQSGDYDSVDKKKLLLVAKCPFCHLEVIPNAIELQSLDESILARPDYKRGLHEVKRGPVLLCCARDAPSSLVVQFVACPNPNCLKIFIRTSNTFSVAKDQLPTENERRTTDRIFSDTKVLEVGKTDTGPIRLFTASCGVQQRASKEWAEQYRTEYDLAVHACEITKDYDGAGNKCRRLLEALKTEIPEPARDQVFMDLPALITAVIPRIIGKFLSRSPLSGSGGAISTAATGAPPTSGTSAAAAAAASMVLPDPMETSAAAAAAVPDPMEIFLQPWNLADFPKIRPVVEPKPGAARQSTLEKVMRNLLQICHTGTHYSLDPTKPNVLTPDTVSEIDIHACLENIKFVLDLMYVDSTMKSNLESAKDLKELISKAQRVHY